ncbi:MAG: sigma-54-dependent Fis family transcriptional regulator [Spirochaetales bacterium]|nr:sigma-54-dependent Fis family transcriptional regulator [Spirochaetales bacterium]
MINTKFPLNPLLIVDDEEDVLESYKMALRFNGINNFILCQDSRQVASILSEQTISVTLLDLFMPHITGQVLLKNIKESHPEIPVIVITGSNRVETAVSCMKDGAFDYMVKPVENSRLTSSIRRALEIRELQDEVCFLKQQVLSEKIDHPEAFSEIITADTAMKSIFKYIEAIAITPKPVLITGESGVGKELIAQSVHKLSGREGEFVPVNVAGLEDTIFSDTLFGHKKGAFTGADSQRLGLIEKASGGTLFLDEMGDLDHNSQVKLLRLLQDHEYLPLGSDIVKKSDARIIAATNVDLNEKQQKKLFRPDLYFRLMTHHIHIPPLRERKEDIPILIDHFVNTTSQSIGVAIPHIPDEIFPLLTSYDFPGNVRELQSIIYDAVSRNKENTLNLQLFKKHIDNHKMPIGISESKKTKGFSIFLSGKFPTLKEVEDFIIEVAMQRGEGNQSIASRLLGINQSTLSRKIRNKDFKET